MKSKNPPAAIAPSAQIQAGHGGAEAEDEGEGEEEHAQMSKAVALPKAVSRASKVRLQVHFNPSRLSPPLTYVLSCRA